MKSSNNPAAPRLVELGVVGRPHGLRGELSIRWQGEGDVPVEIWLGPDAASARPVRVLSTRMHKGAPLVLLEGIGDRTAAEGAREAKIFVPRDLLPQPDEDEAWLEDLIGARILLENGETVGVLDHVEYPAGQMIWALKTSAGREILFPARPEFIAGIDVAGGEVVIAPPPGLLDIYLA